MAGKNVGPHINFLTLNRTFDNHKQESMYYSGAAFSTPAFSTHAFLTVPIFFQLRRFQSPLLC